MTLARAALRAAAALALAVPLAAHVGSPDVFFTGTSWTTASRRVDLTEVPVHVTVPFRVGYSREILVRPGTGTLEHGIDNVRISICR